MTNLSQKINISTSKLENSHKFKNVGSINYYDTFCLICSELDVDLKNVSEKEFDAAVEVFEELCKAARKNSYDFGEVVFVSID